MSKPMVYAIPLMLPGCSLFPTTDIDCQQSGRCASQSETMPKDLGFPMNPNADMTQPIPGPDLAPARWIPALSTNDKLFAIHGAEKSGATAIFVAAASGKIVRGTGSTFATTQAAVGTSNMNDVHCQSITDVYAVDDAGTVYVTANAGMSFTEEKVKSINPLYTITGKGIESLTVGGDLRFGLYNGNSWGTFLHDVGEKQYASWVSTSYWYIAGANGSVAKIADPGTTAWTLMSISGTQEALRGLWGTSDTNLWAVGEAGRIARYNGTGWSKMDQGTNALNAIWGSASNDIWAVGDKGSIYHYNGTSWQTQGSATASNYDLTGIWGDSQGNIWAVGNSLSGSAIFKY